MARIIFCRVVDGRKQCSKCKEWKLLNPEFFRPMAKNPSGYTSPCRECERSYYRDNPERKKHVKETHQKRMANPIEKEAYRERQRARNKTDRVRKINQARAKRKRSRNPAFRLRSYLATRLNEVLKTFPKIGTTEKIVGCSFEQLKAHIESLWHEGMDWSNHGVYRKGGKNVWHIDHIIPCAAFDFSKEEDQRKCFHWSNLRPLWAIENIKKSNWVADYQI